MTPEELRAFREGLGMSRREFAPKLFISEPTLERWERGQGGPREVHLHILGRLREHLGAGRSMAYFEYDASADAPTAGLLHDEKELITEALRGMGLFPLAECAAAEERDWSLRFSPGWPTGHPVNLTLVCEGSERNERPGVDFTLEITAAARILSALTDILKDACFGHGVSWKVAVDSPERVVLHLRQRIFRTGLNAETIRHVIGSLQSCWQRVEAGLVRSHRRHGPERRIDVASASV